LSVKFVFIAHYSLTKPDVKRIKVPDRVLIVIAIIQIVSPVTLLAKGTLVVSNHVQPWYQSSWVYMVFTVVIIVLLFSIRSYEKNRQRLKHEADKNHFMEGILHNTPFALVITDNKGRITIVNKVFESLFGYSKDEIYNRTLGFISPEGMQHPREGEDSQEEHQIGYSMSKRKRKDGSLVEVEIFTEPNIMGGKQLGYLVFYNDISRRLKAESALQKTRKEYKEVLDYLRDGYVETDKNGIITYANLPFIRELGFDQREELIGKRYWDFTQKEFASGVSSKFKTIYETKEPQDHFKTRYVGKDGQTFVGEATFTPVIKEGEVDVIKGTIRNVTQRFEVEKELAIQKDFLDALLEQTPVAVVNVGKDNKISFVNPAFQELFGYSDEESIGKNLDHLLASPDAFEEMSEYSKNLLGQRLYISGKRKRKDGTMTDVEVVAQPFFVGSINYGHLVFYIDISERLKAEAKLETTATAHKAVLETLQDSYFEADSAGYLTYVNQPFIEATKYNHRNELVGKHFRHLVARNSRIKFFTEFKKLYASNRPIKSFDLIYLTKDGHEFSSEIVASPILENGRTVGTRGIIRDISIRVKAEEILKIAKEAAELRASELASINRVAEKVSYSLDLQDILNTACQELTKIFSIRMAGIALISEKQSRLEVLAFHSIVPDPESQVGKILDMDGNLDLQHLIKAKKTIVSRDAQSDPVIGPIRELIGKSGTGSFMIVPLVTRGKTIGLIGMTNKDSEYEITENSMELAETVASQIATALDNAQLHAQTERALDVAERDLEIGSEIQRGFFPQFMPSIPGWEISTYFKAARQVSGDFYDVFPIGKTKYFGIVVADVCDKGVGAALFMVLLRSLIRFYSEQYQKEVLVEEMLENMAVSLNNYIVNNHGQSNMFATLVLSILDPESGKLYYVNGGHDSPVLVDATGQVKDLLNPTGPAFGFSTELPYEFGVIDFMPGDLLLSYTDGFTEARDMAGDFYTEERFLLEAGQVWPSAYSVVKHFEVDVFSHMGGQVQLDDLTLVALRRGMESEVVSHRFTRKAEMPNLPLFRNFVVEVCQLLKVDDNITESFKLAIDEVCSNLILHGYKGMEAGDIRVSVMDLKNEMLITVEDKGHPFDPSFNKEPVLSDDINERKIGGLGVYIVKEMVDDFSYESINGTNCLSLKMRYIQT